MKGKKKYIAIVIIISSSLFFREQVIDFFQRGKEDKRSITNIEKNSPISDDQPKVEIVENNQEEVSPENFPAENLHEDVFLETPFLSQAPLGVWDALHEDACEEASLLMVKYFLEGKKIISPQEGEQEIQKLVAFEKKNGYGPSITLEELGLIAKKYYTLSNYRVKNGIVIDDIKRELAGGNLVIVGAAGKALDNPNFKNGGPNYHMLVIKGYDEKGFITNDPGTRKGDGFRYTLDNLFQSVHDWNPKDILKGEKNYLVIEK